MADKFVARAHHAYTKAKPDEIDLSPGDILRVANNDHDAWWVGFNESTKERGWFPSNFVSRVESKPKAKSKRFVRCIKQYDAVDEDDLSLQVGDIVEVRKELDGWYLGIIDGRKGMFPASYTEETGGPASAEDTSANEPARRPLPVPPVPGGGSGAAAPISPPSLPQRQPPLPPRASTDIQRGSDKLYSMPGADDGADDGSGKKEKQKSGHRISRLFGTKKNKNKDVAELSEAAAHGALSPLADEPPTLNDGDNEEASICYMPG
ncbi:hypothetical protein GGI04_003591 [Coemansia thaxteri]|uniref:SH3 domain-containing protein n=1 Tax=Coemansia thaxteri TaxID=2663907 RepID=A0A9W8BHW5_9FUNG|nr:hypothetical protein GGI04_003591 [Coemansia thaxteri]KAJ2002634.1 hypothetical protein H4R26_003507 [Coemansia thaxteri]KAJ2481089.1 hypothetical protein EV174_003556 [Coemansia sp. RSA 2320]